MAAMTFIDPAIHGSSYPSTYIAPANLQWFGVSSTQGSTTGTLPANPPSGVYGSNTYTLLGASCSLHGSAGVLSGYFTARGEITVIPCGFAPTKVEIWNDTDGIMWTWMLGMASTHAYKENTTGPALTVDTGSAIVVNADAAGGLGDVDYVALSATLAGSSKLLSFRISA